MAAIGYSYGDAADNDRVVQHGQIGVAEILKVTGAPRATIKKRLGELVKGGHVKRIGEGRSSRYVRA